MASVILGLGLIIGLGVSMQWIAKILKIPGIILLLPAGMIVGPVLGLVQPEEIFGNSFFPVFRTRDFFAAIPLKLRIGR